jgi:hypothetical protein
MLPCRQASFVPMADKINPKPYKAPNSKLQETNLSAGADKFKISNPTSETKRNFNAQI